LIKLILRKRISKSKALFENFYFDSTTCILTFGCENDVTKEFVTIHPHDHPEILSLDAGLTRATSPM